MGDSRPFEVRFREKVSPEPNTGCWLWTGSVNSHGYGVIQDQKKQLRAHRVAWEALHGPVPPGLFVCHHCDNPLCLNAEAHLFLGTAKDNRLDCMRKGRANVGRGDNHGFRLHPERAPRGQRNGQAVPWDSIVVAMRVAYARGLTLREVGRCFEVKETTVWDVVTGKNWKHAGGPISAPSSRSSRALRGTPVHPS